MLVAAVFGVSVMTKVTRLGEMANFFKAVFALPTGPSHFLGAAIFGMEALVLCLFLWPSTRRTALVLGGGLAAGYLVFQSGALYLGSQLPCPCMGWLTGFPGPLAHLALLAISASVLLTSIVAVFRMRASSSLVKNEENVK